NHVRKSRLRTPQGACPSARIIKKHHHEKCGRTTLGAQLAPPGSPLPESTLTTARGFVHGHPRGIIAAFNRERALIKTIDLPSSTISFTTEGDDSLHVAVLRTKAMQDFLKTLKIGDVVDITRAESITYIVTNKTVPQPAPAAPQLAAPAGDVVAPAPAQ
ncbi:MAG: hypothetical protein LKH30_05645, partial [Acetobacter fabarum]|nr:hypothetical protein [Acetobacter fabarum]